MRDQQGKMSDERDRMRHRSQGGPFRQAQGRLFEAITQRGGHGRAARIVVGLCHGTTIARVFVAVKFFLCVTEQGKVTAFYPEEATMPLTRRSWAGHNVTGIHVGAI